MPVFRETDFDPTRTHPTYDLFRPSWELNRDFAEMHEHVLREGTYLDRFGEGTATAEPASQYNWRRQACFAMDYCADLIDLRVGNLFRTPPVRTYEDSPHAEFIEAFLQDVDGGRTTMDAFMRDALRQHYVNGVDIVVDKEDAAPGVVPGTLAQEQELGLLPYLTALGPLERLDWSCDSAGCYRWVRYDLGRVASADEGGASGARRYLTLTPSRWRLYEVDGDGRDRSARVATGEMTLGAVPVACFYFRESLRPEYRKVPLSLLTRIAPVARALLNLISQGQLDIYMAIGVLAAMGVDAERLPTEIAPMCWLGFPEGATVEHIRPAVEHVREKREWVRMLMEAILRMGKVIGAAGELKGRATSGFQVEAERTDLDNEMSATAAQAEQVETEIVRLAVSRKAGRLVDHGEIGYSVEYNKKYVLTPILDILRQAKEYFALGVQEDVPQMTRVFLRRVLDAMLKKDNPGYKACLEQIKQADFSSS
jgi:hypothetical protein